MFTLSDALELTSVSVNLISKGQENNTKVGFLEIRKPTNVYLNVFFLKVHPIVL